MPVGLPDLHNPQAKENVGCLWGGGYTARIGHKPILVSSSYLFKILSAFLDGWGGGEWREEGGSRAFSQ